MKAPRDLRKIVDWFRCKKSQKLKYLNFKDVCDRKILQREFSKIQYIIIQAILSRESMKKIIVTDEKYSVPMRLLTVKDNIHTDLRTSQAQFLGRGSQYGEEDSENKILS